MKCPDTNGGAAASTRSPLYDFDENSKLQRPGKGDIRPFYIEKWQRGYSNRLITSTVLGFGIVIYIFFFLFFFISWPSPCHLYERDSNAIPRSTPRSTPRSCRENVCEHFPVTVFIEKSLYTHGIGNVWSIRWDVSATLNVCIKFLLEPPFVKNDDFSPNLFHNNKHAPFQSPWLGKVFSHSRREFIRGWR